MNYKLAGLMLIAIALALILALAAFHRPNPSRPVVPEGAQAGDLVLTPCAFKVDDKQYQADCGTLVVPENPAKADSRLIALPVTRIRAASANSAEPIFRLGGGPGMSNMDFKPPAALLADHDVVLVGYRGADGSSVLDCPEYSSAARTGNPLSDSSLARLNETLAQCMARFQGEGVDLSGYTMREVVTDMEAARAALGYERVNLLSESYGTRVAQIYAYLHPDRIYRSAMLGVNPPGRFVWEPATIDAQLNYYARLYAQDPEFSARTPDLAATLRAVSHKMPRRWLFLPIDADKVKVTTFILLFNRNTAALVFDTYVAAANGDPSGLALMSLMYDFVVPSAFTWGDLYAKAVSADLDRSRNYLADMDPPESILGSPISKLQWGGVTADWPVPPLPAELRQVQTSNVETLLVSGSIDFSTPAQYAAAELLPYLPHGKQVILSEMGHVGDVWSVQPKATERLLTSFYETGVADDSLFTYAPMDFHVSLGFPVLAKIMLGTGVLIVTAVVAALWSVARRMRAGKSDEATHQT